MSKHIPSQVSAITLWVLWACLAVPSCVIKIGPGGTDDDTQGGKSSSNDVSPDDSPKSEQEIGQEVYAQLDPQELAIASAKAGFMTCSLSGTIDALNLDPATLDDATIAALMEQYGPAVAADTEAWLASVDPSSLVYTKVPNYMCAENHGCVSSAKCKYGYVPSQPDEERYQQAKEQALEGFFALTRVIGFMVTLAAPRFLARVPADDLRELGHERVLKLLDGYLVTVEASKTGAFADQDGNIRRTEEAARRARALLETWECSDHAPAPLVQAGRDFLEAFGVPEPEEGWEQWEGPSDENPR